MTRDDWDGHSNEKEWKEEERRDEKGEGRREEKGRNKQTESQGKIDEEEVRMEEESIFLL